MARSENKPVVLDFTASWCLPCQQMLRETFPAPKAARLLEQFVFVKVDTDEHPALANKYGAVGLPDVRLLSPEGKELRRFRDFQGPDAFAKSLDELLAEVAANATGDKLIGLSDDERELKEAFNRDIGKVRLILVLSPTRGPCENGARVVQEKILEEIKHKEFKVYVVWTPVLQEDGRQAAVNAMGHVSRAYASISRHKS